MGRRHRGNGSGTTFRVKAKPGAKPRRKPWAASVTVGWTIEGRPIRRARYASSEREAKAMLLEMLAARDSARPLPDDRMTTGKWLRLWLADLEGVRPNTVKAYERAVRLVLPELGSIPLRKLRSIDVDAALRSVPQGSRSGVRAVLSTAVKAAMRAGHVTTNEAALVRVKGSGAKLTAPDAATVRAVLAELQAHRLHPLYVLLAGTGLRIGEATGLRWEDIDDGTTESQDRDALLRAWGVAPRPRGPQGRADQDGGQLQASSLTVRYQLQRIAGEHVLTDPKTDSAGRVAVLPPAAQEALRAHRVRQAAERIAAGRRWRRTDEDEHGTTDPGRQLVFTTDEGQPLAESTAQWVLAAACRRAGVRHVRPHDLRRFALTTVADAMGMDAARRLGGHTDERMTEGYVARTRELLTGAADALQEAIG